MQIVLIRKNEITKTVLPKKVSGQHFVHYSDLKGTSKPLLAITAMDGKWTIKQTKQVEFLSCEQSELEIKANEFYPIQYIPNNEKMILLIEPISEERAIFNLYNIPKTGIIRIGHTKENEICFCDDLLSETIAATVIYRENGDIIVEDSQSINGTYLNGKRIVRSMAKYGDEIYLVGLRVILGKDFVAVNNPENKVRVSLKLREVSKYEKKEEEEDILEKEEVTFSSAPRYKKEIRKKKINIENPPRPQESTQMPWAVVMGPSITMAFGSVFSSVFTIQNIMRSNGNIASALPTLVMSVCMVLGTIIWPIFAKRFEKRARVTKENIEKREYLEYLNKIEKELQEEIKEQEQIKRENNPTIEECVSRINNQQMTLWERSPKHSDFLEVMLGIGDLPMELELSYPQRKAIDKSTEASEAMYRLTEQKRLLRDVPVTVSFLKSKIVGLIGNRSKVIELTKALLIELTSLHNYDDLKIIFIYDEKERKMWNFVKWIPHLWNREKTVRFFANDVDEIKELSNLIYNVARTDSQDGYSENNTHYLVIATDRILADKAQALKEFVRDPMKYKNISMLALYDERKYLPKTCSVICAVEANETILADFNDISGEAITLKKTVSYFGNPEEIFVNMANIQLDIFSKEHMLPTELTYLEMFEAGKPEHLDVLSQWEENDAVKTLAAPIGVDVDGYLIKLDIHEKAHGPHGLIAGMTGSGKSEFIISYIASMAINYSPEEVAFVLIDFKGGGMADVFKNLPHLAGSITNLDGNELQRSFIAIESALEKRQKLFKEISERKQISNIDIYKYQKLRKEDASLPPLPHLIIISDEFAELKQQHADFMEQLIRTARIGRSLGVHLILATQKPEGVVDEQIKSNIRFKVCLKVQDKADSQSMIGCGDAAMITNAGRFYFQVGNSEVFEYGQSPWSGAPYLPEDQFKKNRKTGIEVLNEQGKILYKVSSPLPKRPAGIPEKQIDALVDYLKNLAQEKNRVCEKLWLEPLQGPTVEKKVVDDITEIEPFVLAPIIGTYDDLQNQQHKEMVVPLTRNGNVILYGASGSDKLTFINQLLVSLIERHTPEELNMYAIDFDAGSLSAFEEAPHMKCVALSNDATEIRNVMEEIEIELDKRKQMFKRFGGDYQNYVKSSEEPIPNLVLIINNYVTFAEDISAGEEFISKIARDGKQYGIFLVLTALDSNSIRFRLASLFSNIYTLQQNNDSEYRELFGRSANIIPAKYTGRGLFKKQDIVYEFQTKMVFEDADNTYDAISSFCKKYAQRSNYQKEQLKQLPETVDEEYFVGKGYDFSMKEMPIAVNLATTEAVCIDYSESPVTFVLYDEGSRINEACLIKEIYNHNKEAIVIDKEIVGMTTEDRIATIYSLEKLVYQRAYEAKEYLEQGNGLPDFEHIYIVIRNYTELFDEIPSEDMRHLSVLMWRITKNYHMHFIVTDHINNISDIKLSDRLGNLQTLQQGIILGNSIEVKEMFTSDVCIDGYCEKGQAYIIKNNTSYLGKVLEQKGAVENE